MKNLKQKLLGIFISILIIMIPAIVLYRMEESGRWFGIITFILFPVAFVFVFVIQIIASIILKKMGRGHAASGIWLVYLVPALIVILFIAYSEYHNYRVAQAAKSDYSARTLDAAISPIENLFIYPSRYDGQYVGDCNESCVNLLRTGLLRTIGTPPENPESTYVLLRYAVGEECRLAQARSGQGQILAKDPTRVLEKNGYLGGCITIESADRFDYDIQINQGPQFGSRYAACCDVADVYERRSGTDVLLGRWKHGQPAVFWNRKIKFNPGKPFEIVDIISVLKSVPVEKELKPFEFTSISAELERIANLSEKGTFYSSRIGPALWLTHIFSQYYRDTDTRFTLTESDKNALIRIIRKLRKSYRWPHFNAYKRYLSEPDMNELLDWINANNRGV